MGGWHPTNPNWKRNTAIAGVFCVVMSAIVFSISIRYEERVQAPHFWIPSSMWSKVPPIRGTPEHAIWKEEQKKKFANAKDF
ncbi:hypothetical protein M885DRAFT_562083 [Pelagophyceae sp. CCMP2097]|nr:hypothetical protein M885DRAFT_562083 [Pelagophyceae sp. CCMP2097]